MRESYFLSIYKDRKLVFQSEEDQRQMQLKLSSLEKGRYIVTMTNGYAECHQVLYIE